jgi:hypothetical protein
MPRIAPLPSERNEIAQELLRMLNFIQKLGNKSGCETHGETKKLVSDINNSMNETRIKIHNFLKTNSHK